MTIDHRFHLVISTNRSPEHLSRCLASIDSTTVSVFVTVVEQRPEPDALAVLQPFIDAGHAEYVHHPVVRGASRGRNAGMARLRGEIVAFPDDDCWYEVGTLERLSQRFEDPALDGASIPCRSTDDSGTMLRWRRRACRVTARNIPRTVVCAGILLRRSVLVRTGGFDEELGTGGGTPWGAGEENDLVLRALGAGARIRFMPDLCVRHPDFRAGGMTDETLAKVRRYNRGFGRVLRKHRLWGQAAHWIARSLVGTVVCTLRGDRPAARFQRTQMVARLQGWLGRDDEGRVHPMVSTVPSVPTRP
ncbi:GT2 family glycosyltransferase [Curtobacterium sp. PhB172]|uniref:glycosyltransferase family 2 protein n=1 Tax=Curtobacterium sp. PhB172 TaxID=2485196 RepID=UPI000FB1F826|nr:glycosyltransferase [Curtobacterium sp. PhB172]ROS65390.1 GT2 family glycosyltransferase [Curtobacterium sp. PhB172]